MILSESEFRILKADFTPDTDNKNPGSGYLQIMSIKLNTNDMTKADVKTIRLSPSDQVELVKFIKKGQNANIK